MNSITFAKFFGDRTLAVASYLWQWDYGQVLKIEGLELPEAYEVHFANADSTGETKTSLGTADGVSIPDEYLLSGQTIYAWIFLHDAETDGETVYKITIPVHKRPQPSDIEPTPVQQDVITQAIAALNHAVTQTGEDVETTAGHVTEASAQADRAETAADEAEASADRAEQAASTAGYMYFYIDDQGHLIYNRTDNTDADFYLDNGRLYVRGVA